MTFFFPMVGRLGNLLFIYAFARAYCEANGYDLCLPPWIGEKIFKIPQAVRSDKPDITMPEVLYQNQQSLIYTRKQVRQWFQIKDELVEKLTPVAVNRKPVLLNVRQGGDYLSAGLVCLGKQCYEEAATGLGYGPDEWEWETDTDPTRLPDFQGDISASGLNTTWVALPSFYRLMTAQILFRANSTFSWWAATLGYGKVYSPVIKGLRGGVTDQYAYFVEGNWPVMADGAPNTDLHLNETCLVPHAH